MTPAYEHLNNVLALTETTFQPGAMNPTHDELIDEESEEKEVVVNESHSNEPVRCDCCGEVRRESEIEEKLLCPAGVEKLAFADITEIRLKNLLTNLREIQIRLSALSKDFTRKMSSSDILVLLMQIDNYACRAIGRAEYDPQKEKVPA